MKLFADVRQKIATENLDTPLLSRNLFVTKSFLKHSSEGLPDEDFRYRQTKKMSSENGDITLSGKI